MDMKSVKQLITAALLAAMCVSVHCEEPIGSADIQLDFNGDGITDSADWNEMREWVKDYKMEDGDFSCFGGQEAPATISLLINQGYGSRSSFLYEDTDVSSISSFFLPTLSLSTTVKNQSPFGTCWAFGTIASVESNLLLKRNGEFDPAKASEFIPENASSTLDLSELYLTYMCEEAVLNGSQKGEGLSPLSDETNARFNIGGFSSDSQVLLTSWIGPLTEVQEPYQPLSADPDGMEVYGLYNPDRDADAVPAAHVQSFFYLDSPAVFEPDLDSRTYVYHSYDALATTRIKQAMLKYGALMFSYDADISMPGENGLGDCMNYNDWCQFNHSDTNSMNHMVSLVGWDDSFPKEKFDTGDGVIPETDGAWLLKNSWGDYYYYKNLYGEEIDEILEYYKGTPEEVFANQAYNYGIPDSTGHGSGYLWVSYCDHSISSVSALDADDSKDGFDYDNIYQYDFTHPTSFTPVILPTGNDGTKTANIFTAEREETLSAVSVTAPQSECTAGIEVFLLSADDTLPDAGKLVSSKTVQLNERGFHTVPLDTPVVLQEGDRFAIVEHVTSFNGRDTVSWLNLETIIKSELQTEDNINSHTSAIVVNPGESFAYVNNGSGFVWTGVDTLNAESGAAEVFEFGNAAIKAYTNNGVKEAAAVPGRKFAHPILYGIAAGIILMAVVYFALKPRKENE